MEAHLEGIWKMIAFACRYGHQPLTLMVGDMTVERLGRFNDAVEYWLIEENKKGGGRGLNPGGD